MTSSKRPFTSIRKVETTSARIAIRQQGKDPEKDEESNCKLREG